VNVYKHEMIIAGSEVNLEAKSTLKFPVDPSMDFDGVLRVTVSKNRWMNIILEREICEMDRKKCYEKAASK
jgi:hypothetical protein